MRRNKAKRQDNTWLRVIPLGHKLTCTDLLSDTAQQINKQEQRLRALARSQPPLREVLPLGPGRRLVESSRASALVAARPVVLGGVGDEVSDAEVLNELLEDWVVALVDVLDLDLGPLGDEVHLALSFLL